VSEDELQQAVAAAKSVVRADRQAEREEDEGEDEEPAPLHDSLAGLRAHAKAGALGRDAGAGAVPESASAPAPAPVAAAEPQVQLSPAEEAEAEEAALLAVEKAALHALREKVTEGTLRMVRVRGTCTHPLTLVYSLLFLCAGVLLLLLPSRSPFPFRCC
jgi:hypothetical protein